MNTLKDEILFTELQNAAHRMERAHPGTYARQIALNQYNIAFNYLTWKGYAPSEILRALGVYEPDNPQHEVPK